MNADRYAASIQRLLLTMLLVTFSTAYLCLQDYKKDYVVRHATALEFVLLALQAKSEHVGLPALKETELPDLYSAAEQLDATYRDRVLTGAINKIVESAKVKEELERLEAGGDFGPKFGSPYDDLPPPFEEREVRSSELIGPLNSPFNPRLPCRAASYRGSAVDSIFIINSLYNSFGIRIPLSKIFLVNFSYRCPTWRYGLKTLLLVDLQDEQHLWMIGIPQSETRYVLNGAIADFLRPISLDRPKFLSDLSDQARAYAALDQKYFLFPAPFIEAAVFELSQSLTGHFRLPTDLQGALSDISALTTTQASLAGVSTTGQFVIEAMPFAITLLVYLVWRRASHLRRYRHTIEGPWSLKDLDTPLDIVIAYGLAALPLVLILVVFFAFALINNAGIGDFLHFEFNWREVLHLAPQQQLDWPFGLLRENTLSVFLDIVFVFFLFALVFGSLAVWELVRIVTYYRSGQS